jgi:mannose-6-phosphate isomerase-like protein (cupin superfamily)
MSYPEPVYLGEGGEATATFRPATTESDLLYKNGTRCHFLATGATTRGLFGLYLWEMQEEPSGPGPHFHRTIQESFFVFSGTIRIHDGRGWRDAQAGDFVHVPEGGIHGFRNESGAPASMLIHFAPGAPREDYFRSNAQFSFTGRLSDEEMAEFYLRHDNHFVEES